MRRVRGTLVARSIVTGLLLAVTVTPAAARDRNAGDSRLLPRPAGEWPFDECLGTGRVRLSGLFGQVDAVAARRMGDSVLVTRVDPDWAHGESHTIAVAELRRIDVWERGDAEQGRLVGALIGFGGGAAIGAARKAPSRFASTLLCGLLGGLVGEVVGGSVGRSRYRWRACWSPAGGDGP